MKITPETELEVIKNAKGNRHALIVSDAFRAVLKPHLLIKAEEIHPPKKLPMPAHAKGIHATCPTDLIS